MRQGFFRDAKAHYGDIMYWSKFSSWKNQTTTPNTSTRYVIFFTNTNDGPVVVEVASVGDAALFGTLLDAWASGRSVDVGSTGEDLGNGGKYLLLPPRYKGETPSGYIGVPSNTYNGIVALRVIPQSEQADDIRKAIAYVKQLKTYPLAAAKSPPEQRYIDMADTLWDGIVRFDVSFYTSLARMINEELAQARDLEMLGLLRPLGIEKGKKFKPDAATRAVLKQASHEVHTWFMERLVNYGQPFWADRKWDIPGPPIAFETGFKWEAADYFDVDARGIGFSQLLRAAGEARRLHFLSRHVSRRARPAAARRKHLPAACTRRTCPSNSSGHSLFTIKKRAASSANQCEPAWILRRADEAQPRRLGGSLHRPEASERSGRELDSHGGRQRLVSLLPVLRPRRAAFAEDMEATGHREGEMKPIERKSNTIRCYFHAPKDDNGSKPPSPAAADCLSNR